MGGNFVPIVCRVSSECIVIRRQVADSSSVTVHTLLVYTVVHDFGVGMLPRVMVSRCWMLLWSCRGTEEQLNTLAQRHHISGP